MLTVPQTFVYTPPPNFKYIEIALNPEGDDGRAIIGQYRSENDP